MTTHRTATATRVPLTARGVRALPCCVVLVLLLATVLLAGCTPTGRDTPSGTATVTPLDPQQAESVASSEASAYDWIPTAGQYLRIFDISSSTTSEELETTLISSDAEDETVTWAVTIRPPATATGWGCGSHYTSWSLSMLMESKASGCVVVSPDGRHVSLMIDPELNEQDEWTIGSSTRFLVLDAVTGQTVREVEVSGVVLGQVLTNDALVIETTRGIVPAAGGSLTVASLTSPDSEPEALPVDQWLVGAGNDSILLATRPSHDRGITAEAGPATVTRMDSGGAVLGTLTGVVRVYRGGWVERFTDPAAAVDLLVTADTMTDEAFTTAWSALSREVVDVDTGNTVDVTGMRVSPARLPTGPGLLVEQPHPGTEPDQAPTYTPVMWMSAADDGQPHTDNLDTATRDH